MSNYNAKAAQTAGKEFQKTYGAKSKNAFATHLDNYLSQLDGPFNETVAIDAAKLILQLVGDPIVYNKMYKDLAAMDEVNAMDAMPIIQEKSVKVAQDNSELSTFVKEMKNANNSPTHAACYLAVGQALQKAAGDGGAFSLVQ